MNVEKVVNAISGQDMRGTKLCDKIIKDINNINETYLAGMENILEVKPSREELLQENFDLKEQLEKAEDELAELRNLCTKEQIADLEYINKRRRNE